MDEAVPRMQESSQPPTPPPRNNPKRAPKEVQSRREKENINRAAGPGLFQGQLVSNPGSSLSHCDHTLNQS